MVCRIFFLLCFLNSLCADSWYDQKLEGWYYFQDQNGGEQAQKERPTTPEEAEEILELEQRQLKRLLSLALLEPSLENTERYLRQQNRWINQSAEFAATWGKVLLNKPYLGDFLLNPTTNYGVLAKREVDFKKRKALLNELSKNCFLLFFFKGADPFSEKAAEVASLFASLNNWTVKGVSLDGQGIKGFQDFEIDRGISKKMGVQVAPSFFISS